METWKEFEKNVITHSAAHHLMAVDDLIQKLGYARVSDVARRLGITRGSVSISLNSLKDAGLIIQDVNRHLRLSDEGQALVDAIKTKRHVVQRLLHDLLGVDGLQAEIDACKFEHLISNQAAARMISFLRFLDSNAPTARKLRREWEAYDASCTHDAEACPSCEHACLADNIPQPANPSAPSGAAR